MKIKLPFFIYVYKIYVFLSQHVLNIFVFQFRLTSPFHFLQLNHFLRNLFSEDLIQIFTTVSFTLRPQTRYVNSEPLLILYLLPYKTRFYVDGSNQISTQFSLTFPLFKGSQFLIIKIEGGEGPG